MKRAIFILVVPFLLAAANRAWWVDYVYEPKSDASKYGQEFEFLDLYTCKTDEYFTIEQCKEIERNEGIFKVVRDLNSDGQKEQWSVGVAKNKTGKYPYANVVVVSDPDTKEVQQILTVGLAAPGFAVFFSNEDELSVYFCMECGNGADIQWKDNKWLLVWPEPY